MSDPTKPDLLIELGVEELPAGMVGPAVDGLRDGVLALLAGIERAEVRTYATPRRLAVVVCDLAAAQPSTEREVTGPPADRAFDAEGRPTEAGVAFAVGKGARAEDLRVVELPKRGRVAAVTVREGGATVVDLLREGLGDVIAKLPFAKRMVWGDGGLAFGRPLQRIVAVYDGRVVPGAAHGLTFTHVTVGHRLAPEPIAVGNEAFWLAALRRHHVEPDVAARRARIAALLEQ
ncbi:MAG TPA: glycine--tRNA ligase subunit beta, partial [Myxococcota bacterium]|nr:glycine--tRNA ligase subunit beta [Myxococcota bacterium]